MRLAVLSDIHGNLANLQKVLAYCKLHPVDSLICLGDVQSLTAWKLLDQLNCPGWGVLGNADDNFINQKKLNSSLKNLQIFKLSGEVKLEGKNIFFSHYPDVVKKAIKSQPKKYALGLHGDTHYPWEETIGQTKIINPGNVANMFYAPTFAIIDLKSLSAKLIFINELI